MENRYSNKVVIMHWLLAAMIIGVLLFGGLILSKLDNSNSFKSIALTAHMFAGSAIFILMLLRVLFRLKSPSPSSINSSQLLDKFAKAIHGLLYLLVILLAISGFRLAFQANLWQLFTFQTITLPSSFAEFSARGMHGNFATILVILIGIHLLGFIYHQFVLKDNIMERMRLKKD